MGFNHRLIIILIYSLNQSPHACLPRSPSFHYILLIMMGRTDKVITISKCSLYNIEQHPITHFDVVMLSQFGQQLLSRKYEVSRSRCGISVVFGFKITYSDEEKNISLVLGNQEKGIRFQIALDLDVLGGLGSQCFSMTDGVIVKIWIQNEQFSGKFKEFIRGGQDQIDNEEFIRKREMFLKGIKEKSEQGKRQLIKTPDFQRESPQRGHIDFGQKIEQLLSKTRQIKEQQLLNQSMHEKLSNKFRKKSPHRQLHDNQRPSRFMPVFHDIQIEEEEINHKNECKIVHEHHHHYSPMEKYTSPYKKLQKKMEISNMICRTNDSESVSSQEQICFGQKQIFNAKMPFKHQHN